MKKHRIVIIAAAVLLALHAYAFAQLAIDIEKRTNGLDADNEPGVVLEVGESITWEYVVTNTGTAPLKDITVTDDQGVEVTCPKTELEPGESMTCSGDGIAVFGQYGNIGTVSTLSPVVSDQDPSHYFGVSEEPGIDIEKLTNGEDADDPPGPYLTINDPVTWTYVVTNTGNKDLLDITVSDDQEEVTVTCPDNFLAPGASMECTGDGLVEEDQYANIGTVTAMVDGETAEVTDTDPSHYYGTSETEGGSATVTIDIKPGEDSGEPAPINLGSRGVVPVAVLSDDGFDAARIDPETVRFAGAAAFHWNLEEVDGDGDQDMIFQFPTQELKLNEDSTEATLTGKTFGGTKFSGTDAIRIVPSNPNGPPDGKPPKPDPKKPPKPDPKKPPKVKPPKGPKK